MHPAIRAVLILFAAAATLVSGWFASTALWANMTTLRRWQRSDALLAATPARDYIEVELARDPDTRHVVTTADHTLFLSLFHHVTVYTDPSDPRHMRLGGLLQLWLWPATMVLVTLICCVALAAAVSLTRGERTVETFVSGRWHFSPPPPPAAGDIVLRPPASEVRAPLFWSLLGIVLVGFAVYGGAMGPFARLWALLGGSVFVLGTCLLSLNSNTLRVAAGKDGLRATSSLGWRQARWDEIKSVETREVFSATRRPFSAEPIPAAGQATRSIVFSNAGGRTLLRMSTRMQPPADAARLFDLCKARTGLTKEFRRIRLPEF